MKIEEPLEKFKNEAKKCVVIEETDNITATVEVVSFALDHDACANNDGEDIHDTYLIRFYELQQLLTEEGISIMLSNRSVSKR